MIKYSLSIIYIVLISCVLHAQPDGSFPSPDFIKELKKNIADEQRLRFDTSKVNLLVQLPLIIHITRNKQGGEGIGINTLQSGLKQVNNYFKPLNLNFVIETSEIIDDYNYSYLNKDDRNMTELLKKHYVPQKINIYFVDEIMIDSVKYYGYSTFPTDKDKDYIFITKDFSEANSIATMLGHFMGLLSTHERTTGEEFVDGSNCATTGDLICDTYSDPNIFNLVDAQCNFKGNMSDSKGMDYVPSVANIMSNSLPQCKCSFTFEQYKRMYYYYIKYRQYLK